MTDKQPEALRLANALEDFAEMKERDQAAALLRTQHAEIVKCHTEIGAQARKNAEQRAAIERKDALLRQAQDFMASALFEDDENGNALYDAITKELQ